MATLEPVPGGDLVTINTCCEAGGTAVRVIAPRPVRLAEIMPVFEDLDLRIVSYSSETAPFTAGRPQGAIASFCGRFLVTDGHGRHLADLLLDRLVERMQAVLRLKLSTTSTIRKVLSINEGLTDLAARTDGLTGSGRLPLSEPPSPAYGFSRQPSSVELCSTSIGGPASIAWSLAHQASQSSIASAGGFTSGCSDGQCADTNEASGSGGHHHDLHCGGGSSSGRIHVEERTSGSRFSPMLSASTATTRLLPSTFGHDGRLAHCLAGVMCCSTGGSSSNSSNQDEEESTSLWSNLTPHDTVERIMSSPVRSIHKDADLSEAKALMTQHNISSLLVDTGYGEPPGFLAKRDFLKVSLTKPSHRRHLRVRDVMTQPVIGVPSTTAIHDCSAFLQRHGVRRVLVVDEAVRTAQPTRPLAGYVGVVSDTDIFRCLGVPQMPAASKSHQSHLQGALSSEVASSELRESGAASSSGAPPSPGGSSVGHGSTCSLYSAEPPLRSLSKESSTVAAMLDRYRAAAALWELDFNEIEVKRKIGEGSFGEVLLGDFRGTKVAIKRLRAFEPGEPPGDEDETGYAGACGSEVRTPLFRQLFEREIEILATIRHPNVVTFIGACHTPPNVCLVTEFCARGSLDHLLHKSGVPLDMGKKVEFAMDIARGMSCLHTQRPPVIHRDLKSANLLVSARLEVKVADFGLSRIKDHAMLIASQAGLEGTIEYCAPEVLRGEPYSEKCDLWSYGVVLWEILMRQRPYADADGPLFLLMMSLGNGTVRLPEVDSTAAPSGVRRVVELCTAFQPSQRPSFREVLALLESEYRGVRSRAASAAVTARSGEESGTDTSVVGIGGTPYHITPGAARAMGIRAPLTPYGTPTHQLPEHFASIHDSSAPAAPVPDQQRNTTRSRLSALPGRQLAAANKAAEQCEREEQLKASSPCESGQHSCYERSGHGKHEHDIRRHGERRGRNWPPPALAPSAPPLGLPAAMRPPPAARRGGRGMMPRARSVPVPVLTWFGSCDGQDDEHEAQQLAMLAAMPLLPRLRGPIDEEVGSSGNASETDPSSTGSSFGSRGNSQAPANATQAHQQSTGGGASPDAAGRRSGGAAQGSAGTNSSCSQRDGSRDDLGWGTASFSLAPVSMSGSPPPMPFGSPFAGFGHGSLADDGRALPEGRASAPGAPEVTLLGSYKGGSSPSSPFTLAGKAGAMPAPASPFAAVSATSAMANGDGRGSSPFAFASLMADPFASADSSSMTGTCSSDKESAAACPLSRFRTGAESATCEVAAPFADPGISFVHANSAPAFAGGDVCYSPKTGLDGGPFALASSRANSSVSVYSPCALGHPGGHRHSHGTPPPRAGCHSSPFAHACGGALAQGSSSSSACAGVHGGLGPLVRSSSRGWHAKAGSDTGPAPQADSCGVSPFAQAAQTSSTAATVAQSGSGAGLCAQASRCMSPFAQAGSADGSSNLAIYRDATVHGTPHPSGSGNASPRAVPMRLSSPFADAWPTSTPSLSGHPSFVNPPPSEAGHHQPSPFASAASASRHPGSTLAAGGRATEASSVRQSSSPRASPFASAHISGSPFANLPPFADAAGVELPAPSVPTQQGVGAAANGFGVALPAMDAIAPSATSTTSPWGAFGSAFGPELLEQPARSSGGSGTSLSGSLLRPPLPFAAAPRPSHSLDVLEWPVQKDQRDMVPPLQAAHPADGGKRGDPSGATSGLLQGSNDAAVDLLQPTHVNHMDAGEAHSGANERWLSPFTSMASQLSEGLDEIEAVAVYGAGVMSGALEAAAAARCASSSLGQVDSSCDSEAALITLGSHMAWAPL